MPIGENVGQAYIRIHADGAAIDDDIRKSFDDSDPTIEQAGRKAGQSWRDGLTQDLKENGIPEWKDYSAKMREAWLSEQRAKKIVDSPQFKRLRADLTRYYKDAGAKFGRELSDGLTQGWIDEGGLDRLLGNMRPELAKVREELRKMEIARHEEALQINAAFDRERLREQKEMLDKAYFLHRQYTLKEQRLYALAYAENAQRIRQAARVQQWGRMQEAAMSEDRRREVERLRTLTQLITRETKQLAAGMASAMPKDELTSRLAEVQSGFRRLNIQNELWLETLRDTDRELRLLHPRLAAANSRITRFSDIIGTSMGRGSRNNLINFFGSMARGLTMLGGKLITLPMQIAGSMADMRTGFKIAQSAGQGFISSIGAAVATGLPGLGTFAATLAGLLITAPLVASVLSMLAASITALAGSLAFAAVGLGGGLVALFAPMAAAATVAAAAFMGLSDAQKEALKADTKPLRDGLKELQDVAREPLLGAIGGWAREVAPVLDTLQGSVRGIADALVDVGNKTVKGLKSDAFATWAKDVGDFLAGVKGGEGAVERFGDIIRQSLSGIGGIFRGMIPFMEETLAWLDKLTGGFSKWANSAKGQNQIKNFFDDAKESIKDVGHFAEEALGFVGDLLGAGKKSGDSLFRDMGDQIAEWRDALEKNPDMLQDWIDDGEEFARTLGRVADSAGRLMDVLDSPEARTVGTFLFQSLSVGITTISTGLRVFGWLWRNTIGRITSAEPLKGTMFDAFIEGTELAVQALVDLKNRTIVLASGIAGAIKAMAPGGKSPLEGFADGAQAARDALWGMENSAKSAGPIIRGAFDNAADAVGKYDRLVKSLPKKLITQVVAQGWEHSAAGVKKLIRQYDLTPKQVSTLVKLLGHELSQSQLKKLQDELIKTGKMEPKPKVGMDHKMFDQGKNAVTTAMRGVDGSQATVKINADNSDAMSGINATSAALHSLPTLKNITIKVTRQMGGEPLTAEGGVFVGAQRRIIGEAGPEAVVPLNRPLGQVDPAVRYLSAIAQGLKPPGMANGGVAAGPSKVIDVGGMNIYTVSDDPEAVAHQVVNQLVATGY